MASADPAALLARHGLTGAYQVHVAPVVLTPDLRAHQVFLGFTGPDVHEALQGWFADPPMGFGSSGAVPLDSSLILDGEAFVLPAQSADNPGGLAGVVWLVDRLLGPGGCPWDQAQTHESLCRHLIEESYELVDAVHRGDSIAMREEAGDVLLQPIMHGQIASGWNTVEAARLLVEKLVRRHPHVFGDVEAKTEAEVLANWDRIKKQEKSGSVLAGVPRAMPSLLRALEVSKRAARAGFEWPDIDGVWAKVREEELELLEALASGSSKEIESELGDLLFTIVNIARWAKVDPEEALRRMVDRFSTRFEAMEALSDRPLHELSPEEWDSLWNQAKRASAKEDAQWTSEQQSR